MSSRAARLGGLSGAAAYAASRGRSIVHHRARQGSGREGIRVNALRPASIATEIQQGPGGLAHIERLAEAAVPLGRTGTAEEVAEAVLWLASDAASYVHGAIVDVSGGR